VRYQDQAGEIEAPAPESLTEALTVPVRRAG